MNSSINIEQSKLDKLKILISELDENIFRIKSTKKKIKLLTIKNRRIKLYIIRIK